ncbi:hypothetical protein L249_2270 [Ophiocordyceps polyrhachis-furcata BCC 54312]|uniref:Uncharacterized protein n=1 Tax=Ophiocordyceps polyrhachis-furcata BCC 54312 TaxID=1330021 RepID=A0A367LQJ3_9HYPO|nr:hypothetical protein L249_2270 [Ophiocordyceps polyrhachis-furcata BCC 54312]
MHVCTYLGRYGDDPTAAPDYPDERKSLGRSNFFFSFQPPSLYLFLHASLNIIEKKENMVTNVLRSSGAFCCHCFHVLPPPQVQLGENVMIAELSAPRPVNGLVQACHPGKTADCSAGAMCSSRKGKGEKKKQIQHMFPVYDSNATHPAIGVQKDERENEDRVGTGKTPSKVSQTREREQEVVIEVAAAAAAWARPSCHKLLGPCCQDEIMMSVRRGKESSDHDSPEEELWYDKAVSGTAAEAGAVDEANKVIDTGALGRGVTRGKTLRKSAQRRSWPRSRWGQCQWPGSVPKGGGGFG